MKEQHTTRPESRKTISIIVPVYKTERFLNACIASRTVNRLVLCSVIKVNYPFNEIFCRFAQMLVISVRFGDKIFICQVCESYGDVGKSGIIRLTSA